MFNVQSFALKYRKFMMKTRSHSVCITKSFHFVSFEYLYVHCWYVEWRLYARARAILLTECAECSLQNTKRKTDKKKKVDAHPSNIQHTDWLCALSVAPSPFCVQHARSRARASANLTQTWCRDNFLPFCFLLYSYYISSHYSCIYIYCC